ncbi:MULTISPECIES: hypothetical protein [Saccharothrix]|uniref:hypothetical protein n=1 Tax=Saccharothrix TaxID=2071 RepID=UPI000939C896|nr:hypothetical protein [Saccharothrix sp. CB00851]OKI21529.1 hypothetical protein A6A25_09545 [Saccharothrix sp. CB00851]
MLKKAGTLAAVVAGLMLVGAPAFAVAGEPHEEEHGSEPGFMLVNKDDDGNGNVSDQFGLLNFGNDSDVASGLSVCQTELNVLLGIPVLSNNDESICLTSDDDGS